jgi:hypothetical protein
MEYAATMFGALGLAAIATVYYVFLRKPADKPAATEQR